MNNTNSQSIMSICEPEFKSTQLQKDSSVYKFPPLEMTKERKDEWYNKLTEDIKKELELNEESEQSTEINQSQKNSSVYNLPPQKMKTTWTKEEKDKWYENLIENMKKEFKIDENNT